MNMLHPVHCLFDLILHVPVSLSQYWLCLCPGPDLTTSNSRCKSVNGVQVLNFEPLKNLRILI